MYLFNFFKKRLPDNSDNGVLGPNYLEGYTKTIPQPKHLKPYEWRRQLATPAGRTQFRVKYYGDLNSNQQYICSTDFSKPLVYAECVATKQSILVFDGCQYGYDALFATQYTQEQIAQRTLQTYTDAQGNSSFELIISIYYQYDFDNEMAKEIDAVGDLTLENGTIIKLSEAKRNGFDVISVRAIAPGGTETEILSEELG
jgi:hypothetical protein